MPLLEPNIGGFVFRHLRAHHLNQQTSLFTAPAVEPRYQREHKRQTLKRLTFEDRQVANVDPQRFGDPLSHDFDEPTRGALEISRHQPLNGKTNVADRKVIPLTAARRVYLVERVPACQLLQNARRASVALPSSDLFLFALRKVSQRRRCRSEPKL